METQKQCRACGKTLLLENFYQGRAKCIPCYKELVRIKAQANPEARKESVKSWAERHKNDPHQIQRVRQKGAARWLRITSDPNLHEHSKEISRASQRRHLETGRLRSRRYKAQKKINGGSHTWKEWLALCEKYDNACLLCGFKDKPLTVDHVIPVSLEGSNNIDNIQPLCGACNSKKCDREWDFRFK